MEWKRRTGCPEQTGLWRTTYVLLIFFLCLQRVHTVRRSTSWERLRWWDAMDDDESRCTASHLCLDCCSILMQIHLCMWSAVGQNLMGLNLFVQMNMSSRRRESTLMFSQWENSFPFLLFVVDIAGVLCCWLVSKTIVPLKMCSWQGPYVGPWPVRIGLISFQARCRIRKLNLALVSGQPLQVMVRRTLWDHCPLSL